MKCNKFTIYAVALFLVGCGSGDSGGSVGTSNNTILEGVWQQGCTVAEDNESTKATIKYSSSNVEANLSYFSDSSCEVSKASVVLEGTFAVGDMVILNSGESVYKITRDLTQSRVSYDTNEFIAIVNSKKLCGYANWESTVLKDVSDCSTFDFKNDLKKDIVKIDANNIFYGDSDFLDSDGFPTRLEAGFYSKQ